jgi:hypothetical protein
MNKYHDAYNIMSWKHDIELQSDVHLNPVAHTWQNEPIALKVKIVHQESSISSSLHSSEDILNAIHQGQLQQQRLTETIQLPTTELQTFDGDPLKYRTFLRSFENTVDKQTGDTNAKLTCLLQYCKFC